MSTSNPATRLTPDMQAAAHQHLDHILTMEQGSLLKIQLSFLELLVYYHRLKQDDRLNIRSPEEVYSDVMNVCWLFNGLHRAQESGGEVS